jgi:hypothetical protein
MADGVLYVIERLDVRDGKETLSEKVQLVYEGGALSRWGPGDSRERLPTTDVPTAIANEDLLSEVRPDQITRITADESVVAELPFALKVPGYVDEFDESRWSDDQIEEHTLPLESEPRGRFRVLYVNGERWCAWETPEGPRMLPVDPPEVRFTDTWGALSFMEGASMTAGYDNFSLGLVTPVAVAGVFRPDPGIGEEGSIYLWRRDPSGTDDGRIFVEWLIDWAIGQCYGFSPELGPDRLLAQLFVEAALHGRNGDTVYGDELDTNPNSDPDFGNTGSSEWTLRVEIDKETIECALDEISHRSEATSEIVTAAREPDSPAGKARQAALEAWANRLEPDDRSET